MLLEARNLHIGYGDAPAVWDVSLDVAAGEIVSVIGPNGAGKTTLINAIAGLLRCRQGELRFDGVDMTGVRRPRLLHAMASPWCPRAGACLPRMSVEENLELGCYLAAARARRDQSLERVYGTVSHPARQARPARRGAVGRPAADGGDRPRVDGAAAHRAVRRAVAWAGALNRRRHVRDHRAGARGGRGRAAGRAERAEGCSASPTVPTCWSRDGS